MKILIIGDTGLIGSHLKYKINQIKELKLFTLSRSQLSEKRNHFKIDILYENNLYSKIGIKFDIVINCIDSKIYKKRYNLDKYYLKIFSLLNKNSIIFEISSLSAFPNFFNKKKGLTYYGKRKLYSENLIKKNSKILNYNFFIYRVGAVCSKKNVDIFIFSKLNKLIVGKYFFNLFNKKTQFFKITFLEDISDLIIKNILHKNEGSKIITIYNNINFNRSLNNFKPNLNQIKINPFYIISLISYFNRDLSLNLDNIFNFSLKSNEQIGKNYFEIKI